VERALKRPSLYHWPAPYLEVAALLSSSGRCSSLSASIVRGIEIPASDRTPCPSPKHRSRGNWQAALTRPPASPTGLPHAMSHASEYDYLFKVRSRRGGDFYRILLMSTASSDRRLWCWQVVFAAPFCGRHLHRELHLNHWSESLF
jgi:hypothetical protein